MTPSDGERSIVLAPFSESRVSASRLEPDAPVIVGTSSTCYSPLPPLIPLSRSIARPAIRGWQTTVDLPPRGEGKGRPTVPSKRLRFTALLPSSEIELTRNGSGSWRRRAPMFIFFFSYLAIFFCLSIVSETILARVAYPSVDILTALDDDNLKKIRGVPQLPSFVGEEGDWHNNYKG